MVGSAGTRQPAESRSQACHRACPAHDAGVVHLRPRLGPANSLSDELGGVGGGRGWLVADRVNRKSEDMRGQGGES